MIEIIFDKKKHIFNTYFQEFYISGKEVKFATTYKLINPKTGNHRIFCFDHSTGSEWEKDTIWVYKSKDGIILNLLNDDMTEDRKEHYLKHKLKQYENNPSI